MAYQKYTDTSWESAELLIEIDPATTPIYGESLGTTNLYKITSTVAGGTPPILSPGVNKFNDNGHIISYSLAWLAQTLANSTPDGPGWTVDSNSNSKFDLPTNTWDWANTPYVTDKTSATNNPKIVLSRELTATKKPTEPNSDTRKVPVKLQIQTINKTTKGTPVVVTDMSFNLSFTIGDNATATPIVYKAHKFNLVRTNKQITRTFKLTLLYNKDGGFILFIQQATYSLTGKTAGTTTLQNIEHFTFLQPLCEYRDNDINPVALLSVDQDATAICGMDNAGGVCGKIAGLLYAPTVFKPKPDLKSLPTVNNTKREPSRYNLEDDPSPTGTAPSQSFSYIGSDIQSLVIGPPFGSSASGTSVPDNKLLQTGYLAAVGFNIAERGGKISATTFDDLVYRKVNNDLWYGQVQFMPCYNITTKSTSVRGRLPDIYWGPKNLGPYATIVSEIPNASGTGTTQFRFKKVGSLYFPVHVKPTLISPVDLSGVYLEFNAPTSRFSTHPGTKYPALKYTNISSIKANVSIKTTSTTFSPAQNTYLNTCKILVTLETDGKSDQSIFPILKQTLTLSTPVIIAQKKKAVIELKKTGIVKIKYELIDAQGSVVTSTITNTTTPIAISEGYTDTWVLERSPPTLTVDYDKDPSDNPVYDRIKVTIQSASTIILYDPATQGTTWGNYSSKFKVTGTGITGTGSAALLSISSVGSPTLSADNKTATIILTLSQEVKPTTAPSFSYTVNPRNEDLIKDGAGNKLLTVSKPLPKRPKT